MTPITNCPNCDATMNDGDPCPECEHDDGDPDCGCASCRAIEKRLRTVEEPRGTKRMKLTKDDLRDLQILCLAIGEALDKGYTSVDEITTWAVGYGRYTELTADAVARLLDVTPRDFIKSEEPS